MGPESLAYGTRVKNAKSGTLGLVHKVQAIDGRVVGVQVQPLTNNPFDPPKRMAWWDAESVEVVTRAD
jgi:hypothetical protein